MTKGRWITYSAEELAWVQANAILPAPELHAEFCATFSRTDVSQANLVCLRKRNGWRTGRTGQFNKGIVPPNKGRKGYFAPGSEKGWFKKGNRTGRANHVYKPIGTERLSEEGYLERKVHDGLPLQSRWRAVHLINWEAAHGPIREGHRLKCIDGDRQNADPSNWTMIPKSLSPYLNGSRGRGTRWITYDAAHPDLKPVILASAKLQHAVRIARKGGA